MVTQGPFVPNYFKIWQAGFDKKNCKAFPFGCQNSLNNFERGHSRVIPVKLGSNPPNGLGDTI